LKQFNRLAGVLCAALILIATGCQRPDTFTTAGGFVSPLKPADITYEKLAAQYNAAIEPLATLWSRADIDIEWADIEDDGDRKYRSESGNGKFIMRRGEGPIETAMTVEKLGKIYLWAGSNQTGYYLFDRVDGDNKTLYAGKHLAIGRGKAFPLPMHPSMVPTLLGLEPLPTSLPEGETLTKIDLYGEQYLLSMPELGMRMLIDPETFRPTRVDLTDRKGFSILTAKLAGQLEVEASSALDSPPLICDKAEVYVAGYESRFTLDFQSATTSTRRIKDQMFDLEALKKALKPDQVIDLDQ
jgi:hypothetical protein